MDILMEIRLFQILGYNVCMYRNLEQIKGYFTVTFFSFFCRQRFLQILEYQRPEFNWKELKSVGHYKKLAEKGPKSQKKLSIWFRNQQSQATNQNSSIEVKILRNKPFATVWTMTQNVWRIAQMARKCSNRESSEFD